LVKNAQIKILCVFTPLRFKIEKSKNRNSTIQNLKMRSSLGTFIFLAIMLVLDSYVFLAIKIV